MPRTTATPRAGATSRSWSTSSSTRGFRRIAVGEQAPRHARPRSGAGGACGDSIEPSPEPMSDRWTHLHMRWCPGCAVPRATLAGVARTPMAGTPEVAARRSGRCGPAPRCRSFSSRRSRPVLGRNGRTSDKPPFVVGSVGDVVQILRGQHARAWRCTRWPASPGSSPSSPSPCRPSITRVGVRFVHERGQPVAMAFVVCATGFSLSLQAYTLGTAAAQDAATLHHSPALLLLGLLPHARTRANGAVPPAGGVDRREPAGRVGAPAGSDDRHGLDRGTDPDRCPPCGRSTSRRILSARCSADVEAAGQARETRHSAKLPARMASCSGYARVSQHSDWHARRVSSCSGSATGERRPRGCNACAEGPDPGL